MRPRWRNKPRGKLVTNKNIPAKDRLIFAMDVPDCDRARTLAEELGDSVTFYKIGLRPLFCGG